MGEQLTTAPRPRQTSTGGPKLASVDVIATKDLAKPSGVSFDLASNWKIAKDRLQFDKKKDKVKKGDPYHVEFNLQDPDHIGLRFLAPKEEAMWVSQGLKDRDPPCPDVACHNNHFEATAVSDYKLVVNNPDDDIERIAFTLRFRKPGENPGDPDVIVPYDPITDNQNGGH